MNTDKRGRGHMGLGRLPAWAALPLAFLAALQFLPELLVGNARSCSNPSPRGL